MQKYRFVHDHTYFTGVEGGFQTDDKKFTFEENNSVVVLPDWKIFPLPDPELPQIVSTFVLYSPQLSDIFTSVKYFHLKPRNLACVLE